MAARNRVVSSSANQEDWERSNGDGIFRGNFVWWKAACLRQFADGKYRCRAKKRFAKEWAELQTSVVIAYLPKIRERVFCDDSLDSRLDRRRLQRDCCSHGYAQRSKVPHFFLRKQCSCDCNAVVAFLPAIRRHIAVAFAVRPRIHHDHVIAVP